MDNDAVERNLSLLRIGVPVRVPPRDMPYTDRVESTIHSLGWGYFERRDAWRAFEPGHGEYGGTETAVLSQDDLRKALSPLRAEDVSPVLPWPEGPGQAPLSSLLPRVLRGEASLTAWFDASEGTTRRVIGDGSAFYCLTLRGGRLERVLRWRSEDMTAVGALLFPGSSVGASPPDALVGQSRERVERHEELHARLGADPGVRLRTTTRAWLTRGERFPILCFWGGERGHHFVTTSEPWTVRAAIEGVLSEQADASLSPLSADLRRELSESESELFARHQALLRGEAMFQYNTSLPRYHIWVDGQGYEIAAGEGEVSIEQRLDKAPDCLALAEPVRMRAPDPRLHPVPPELLASLRRRLARS